MEPGEHHLISSAVPYMLLVKQKVSTSGSSASTGVTEAILPKGFCQSGTWICWFNCSGTIFIHGTRGIQVLRLVWKPSKKIRIALKSWIIYVSKSLSPNWWESIHSFPYAKSLFQDAGSVGFTRFRIDPNIQLHLCHQRDCKNPPNIWFTFSVCFFLLPLRFRISFSIYMF